MALLGLYRDYRVYFWGYRVYFWGYRVYFWGYKGIMENKMETTLLYRGYTGIMEKKGSYYNGESNGRAIGA